MARNVVLVLTRMVRFCRETPSAQLSNRSLAVSFNDANEGTEIVCLPNPTGMLPTVYRAPSTQTLTFLGRIIVSEMGAKLIVNGVLDFLTSVLFALLRFVNICSCQGPEGR